MHHTHCAVGKKTFIASIDPDAPARTGYGQSERKQKRRAQKIEKSRGFDLRSLHQGERATGIETDFGISCSCAIVTETCANQRINRTWSESALCRIRANKRSPTVRFCPKRFGRQSAIREIALIALFYESRDSPRARTRVTRRIGGSNHHHSSSSFRRSRFQKIPDFLRECFRAAAC